jgi:hypothetical protein
MTPVLAHSANISDFEWLIAKMIITEGEWKDWRGVVSARLVNKHQNQSNSLFIYVSSIKDVSGVANDW